jgi:hypothetical protein
MGDDSIIVGTVDGVNALIVLQAGLYAPLPLHYEIDWTLDGRAVRVADLDKEQAWPIAWQPLTKNHQVVRNLSFADFQARLKPQSSVS